MLEPSQSVILSLTYILEKSAGCDGKQRSSQRGLHVNACRIQGISLKPIINQASDLNIDNISIIHFSLKCQAALPSKLT